jgi:catechol 2,3-dioxygenase-like lactoylglutathione lyase family enzyme
MASAVAFYEALGAEIVHGSRDGDWVLLRLGAAEFSLLAHPANPEQQEGQVELNLASVTPLSEVVRYLRARGITPIREATDEAFGSQLQLATPDGLLVKVNYLEPDLYR